MAAYITVGAKTSHGGTVITGSPHTTHNGIPIARIGDKVMCKKCKKITTIVSGDPAFVVDGAPIARGGDATSCGAKLIATQQFFMESGFDVMGIEPPAPLQFPKSKPDDLLRSNFSSTKGLNHDNKSKKPTGYRADGTKQTQKEINDDWAAYYDHKKQLESAAINTQREDNKSFLDKTLDFVGLGNSDQQDNILNTARNGAVTAGTKTMSGAPGAMLGAGDVILGAGPAVYGGIDTELRKDYERFVREGKLPVKPGASALPSYDRTRKMVNWQKVTDKYKGAGWNDINSQGMSPQREVYGIASGKIKQ